LHDELAEPEPAEDSDQSYHHQQTEPESASQTDIKESGAENPPGDVSAPFDQGGQGGEDGDSFASKDYPEGEIESEGDGELPIDDHGMNDQQDEGREAYGEAWRRLGSSVLR
jgi:hypothetical protein